MRKLLIGVALVFGLQAQTTDLAKRCADQLKQDRDQILSLVGLHAEQLQAINEFAEKGPTVTLEYKDGKYLVRTTGEIQVWDLDASNTRYPYSKVTFDKETVLEFKDDAMKDRPHNYIGNVLKFGGVLMYNQRTTQIQPDISLMYEFFSFDKLFPKFYGLSLNAGVGLRHVGISLAYQFVNTKWFRNTNILVGYSYMFLENQPAPFAGIALNF